MIQSLMIKWSLKRALTNPKYPRGRSIIALAVIIDRSQKKTREYLEEIGARKITLKLADKEVEGYTLRKKYS